MRRIIAVAVALGAGAVVAVAGAGAKSSNAAPTYTVHLTGKQEVPKASPKGKGTFKYQLVTKSGLLCYSLTWSGIGTPTAAHVHKGPRGVEGAVFIVLSGTAPVAHSGCVTATKSQLNAIKKNRKGYYVNVHTAKYPGGAIRGQL
jgi:CHRD domain